MQPMVLVDKNLHQLGDFGQGQMLEHLPAPWFAWLGFIYIWVIFRANVGTYSIHGAYGSGKPQNNL